MFLTLTHTHTHTHTHSLQKFKLNIANTVITQENSSLTSMGTSDLLDLFQLSESANEKVIIIANKCTKITPRSQYVLYFKTSIVLCANCPYVITSHIHCPSHSRVAAKRERRSRPLAECAVCWKTYRNYGVTNNITVNMT